MKVLFYQPNHTGHHFAYLARMLPGFLRTKCKIQIATTQEAIDSPEFQKSLSVFKDEIKLIPCCTPAPKSPAKNAEHRYQELVKAIQLQKPDHVGVCYLDGIWEYITKTTLFGKAPWPKDLVVEGWMYRGRFGDIGEKDIKSKIRRWLFSRLLKRGLFQRIHIDHEILFDFAISKSRETKNITEPILTPNPIALNPIKSKEDARQELNISTDGKWIVLNGIIAKFKRCASLTGCISNFA